MNDANVAAKSILVISGIVATLRAAATGAVTLNAGFLLDLASLLEQVFLDGEKPHVS